MRMPSRRGRMLKMNPSCSPGIAINTKKGDARNTVSSRVGSTIFVMMATTVTLRPRTCPQQLRLRTCLQQLRPPPLHQHVVMRNLQGEVPATAAAKPELEVAKLANIGPTKIPHRHSKTPENFPGKGLGNHNYCRNPNNRTTI